MHHADYALLSYSGKVCTVINHLNSEVAINGVTGGLEKIHRANKFHGVRVREDSALW